MTRMKRKTILRQEAVTDVMSCLSELPERVKAPDTAVSLSEIFRTKEYLAEIKNALKKGYSFDDLSAIFTKKCGVNISARQLKYHCTREKNRRVKGKLDKKAEGNSVHEGSVLSTDSSGENTAEGVKENFIPPDSQTRTSSNVSGFSFESRTSARAEGNADPEAFPINVRPKES